jgi:hypothetical protein
MVVCQSFVARPVKVLESFLMAEVAERKEMIVFRRKTSRANPVRGPLALLVKVWDAQIQKLLQ